MHVCLLGGMVLPVGSRTSTWLALLLLLLHFVQCDSYIRGSYGSRMDVNRPVVASFQSPQFDVSHSRDVTALSGKVAVLNCRVHNIRNKTVSWIRHRDIHLLTVGRYTYTSDQRFRALHEDDADDWLLKVNYVQTRDSGIYECQVSTTPPMSHFVTLTVVKPSTRILGGPDLHINRGSTINLTCVVQFSPEPPDFIQWHHNAQVISYDSDRGGITVIIEKGDITTSTLLIQNAHWADSGNYACYPSTSQPTNITVHVLNGEHPEAMQHAGQSNFLSSSLRTVCLVFVVCKLLRPDFFPM